MIMLFNYFDSRFWREMVVTALDPWSMLSLIQTSKHLNRNKTYVYMLIYQKICMKYYEYMTQTFKIKYRTYIDYTIYCNKDHLATLIRNNKTIRSMMEQYIKSHKTLSTGYIYCPIQVMDYEKLLSLY